MICDYSHFFNLKNSVIFYIIGVTKLKIGPANKKKIANIKKLVAIEKLAGLKKLVFIKKFISIKKLRNIEKLISIELLSTKKTKIIYHNY